MTFDVHAILSGCDQRMIARVLRCGLAAVEPVYRAAIGRRNEQFDSGRRVSRRLPRPVISVGNITTGGTGKTPTVIDLAQRLRERGEQPAVLLRGYKAGSMGSDEAAELAQALGPAIPVRSGADRYASGMQVLQEQPNVSVFLLDDGFQHRQLHRDFDLVLLDATEPFGFGHVLPRGLLREPVQALGRADAVVITRCEQVSCESLQQLDTQVQRISGGGPTAHLAHHWTKLRDGEDQVHPVEWLKSLRVAGACAIGNPAAFESTLRERAGEVVEFTAFADHHEFTPAQVKALAGARDIADALVVTEKDWVKLQRVYQQLPASCRLRVLRPVLGISWLEGEEAAASLVGQMLDAARQGQAR